MEFVSGFVYAADSDDEDDGYVSVSDDELEDGFAAVAAVEVESDDDEDAEEDLRAEVEAELLGDMGGGAGGGGGPPPAAAAAAAPVPAAPSPAAAAAGGGGMLAAFGRAMRGAFSREAAAADAAAPPPAEAVEELRRSMVEEEVAERRRVRLRPAKKEKRRRRRSRDGHASRFRRRVDTNVLSIDFGTLGDSTDVATGDCVFCDECNVALNSESVIWERETGSYFKGGKVVEDAEADEALVKAADGMEGTHVWKCEFCGFVNALELDEEELPAGRCLDYVLEPPPAPEMGRAASEGESSIVIFAIDISGSMCVTSEVRGKLKLKGARGGMVDGLEEEAAADARGDQRLPGESADVTYVSRLQCVQAAVESQITALLKDDPTKKVGLITFAREVTIHGDASGEPRILAGDRLSDYADLIRLGGDSSIEQTIADSVDALKTRLFELEEGGPTALGPAAVAAVAMASKVIGSRVVLCTDGVANVGLGSLDGSEEEQAASAEFYSRLASYAAEQSVTIDVIGIEGDGCDLATLGVMPEVTGGNMESVNPLELTNNFSNIMASPILATNVRAALFLHRGMQFRSVDVSGSTLRRDVGNVNADTELTFEYGLRSKKEREELGLAELKALPFQVQIEFTKLDGSRCIRVISNVKPVTRERHVAEESVDMAVLGAHVKQQCASMADAGGYREARKNAIAWTGLMQRNIHRRKDAAAYEDFVGGMAALDADLDAVEKEEEADLELASVKAAASAGDSAARSRLGAMRKKNRAKKDKLSSMLYKTKKAGRVSKKKKKAAFFSRARSGSG
eukprot:PLAT13174.1.p1 GENE.PLAT13174.1~~PLAT13174.1.p1  ORF type:complete len:812 (-),score=424.03 PLAT13174.1:165-2561(-)